MPKEMKPEPGGQQILCSPPELTRKCKDLAAKTGEGASVVRLLDVCREALKEQEAVLRDIEREARSSGHYKYKEGVLMRRTHEIFRALKLVRALRAVIETQEATS